MSYQSNVANGRQGFLLYLPRELHRQLKRQAKSERRSMTKIATEALERELAERHQEGTKNA